MSDASSLQDFSKIFSLPSSESLVQSSYPESLSKKFSSRAFLRFGIVTDDKNWISSSNEGNFRRHFVCFFFARHPRNIHACFTRAMAQFFLKIAHLSFSMGPAPSLTMVFSYGLRPRLWLLSGLERIPEHISVVIFVSSRIDSLMFERSSVFPREKSQCIIGLCRHVLYQITRVSGVSYS